MIDKSVLLLRTVAHRPCTLAELVEATGLARATAHRMAAALEVHGLLRRDGSGRYVLGPTLIALGAGAVSAVPVAADAGPAMAELRDQTGESVQLYVRQGDQRICVAALESPHGLRTIVPLGAALPLRLGSGGRVLDPTWTPDPDRCWEASVGEREPGVASVSAAVRSSDTSVVAAISVSGPLERTGPNPGERYGEAVCDAARRIERAAGLTPRTSGSDSTQQ